VRPRTPSPFHSCSPFKPSDFVCCKVMNPCFVRFRVGHFASSVVNRSFQQNFRVHFLGLDFHLGSS
jgi:hypothetical protein